MAEEFQISGKVKLDDSQAKGSVKSLKAQLKEATQELQKTVAQFGVMSDEAANAAKAVANLKDEIGDASALAEAFSPEAKFTAFAGAVQGVAGGFAAAQGAMALFGNKSEAVEETLKKVQGALALSQGLNSVMESIDAFKNLNAVLQQNAVVQRIINFVMQGQFKTNAQLVATKEADVVATETQTVAQTTLATATTATSVAMRVLRAAIISTGIGAIVIAVIALVQAMMDWLGTSEEAKKEQEKLNKAVVDGIEADGKYTDAVIDNFQHRRAIYEKEAELAGKSKKQILADQIAQNGQEVGIYEDRNNKIRKMLADEKAKGEKMNVDAWNKLIEQLEKNKKAQLDLERDTEMKRLEIQMESQRLQQQAMDINEKAKLTLMSESEKTQYTANKDFEDKKKKLQEAGITDFSTIEAEKNKIIKDAQTKAHNDQVAKNKERSDKVAATRKAEAQRLQDIDNLYFEARKSKMTEQQIAEAELERKFEENKKKLKELGGKDEALLKEAYEIEKKKITDKYKNEELANTQAFEKQLANIVTETRIAGIKDENEKAKQEVLKNYQDQFAEIDTNEKLTAQQKLDLKKALKLKEAQELALIDQQIQQQELDKKVAEYDAIIQDNTIKFSLRQQAVTDELNLLKESKEKGLITDQEYTEKEKQLAQARQDIGKAEVQAKEQQLAQIGGALNALSQLAGENTAVGKALAIAGTAISTYQAAQKAYASAFMPVPTPASPALGAVFAGIAVAQGLANIKKIVSTKIPGVAGSKGGSTSMPSTSSVTPPLPPQVGSTMINQGQVNQMVTANATARAYVVESDMTSGQERIERINRAARIN
jgi:hypothetical protein